jgi:hypothetical protein
VHDLVNEDRRPYVEDDIVVGVIKHVEKSSSLLASAISIPNRIELMLGVANLLYIVLGERLQLQFLAR